MLTVRTLLVKRFVCLITFYRTKKHKEQDFKLSCVKDFLCLCVSLGTI